MITKKTGIQVRAILYAIELISLAPGLIIILVSKIPTYKVDQWIMNIAFILLFISIMMGIFVFLIRLVEAAPDSN